MHPIARYRQLSAFERGLLFRALLLVPAVRVGLAILPFRVVQNAAEIFGKPSGKCRAMDFRNVRQVAWAIEAVSCRVPGASCLTQGIAMRALLGRLGQRAELCLGVARNPDGKLEAHAWVETQGRIVIGGSVDGFHRFTRLQQHAGLPCAAASKNSGSVPLNPRMKSNL